MLPRVVYRTHYQAVGLPFFDLAVLDVLSPVKAYVRETAAERLSKAARSRGWKRNPAACAYLLDEAQALGLVTRNLVLAPSSIGYRAASKSGQAQGAGRRWFYLRHFIQSDGAVFVKLLDAVSQASYTVRELFTKALFDDIMTGIYEFYLLSTPDIREKRQIRLDLKRLSDLRIKGLRSISNAGDDAGLDSKTRKHKLIFHLEAMRDLDLIEMNSQDNIVVTPSGRQLLSVFPDLRTLESVTSRPEVFEQKLIEFLALEPLDPKQEDISSGYAEIKELNVALVAVESLYALLNIRLSQSSHCVTSKALEDMLDVMRRARPSKVHVFHQGQLLYGSLELD